MKKDKLINKIINEVASHRIRSIDEVGNNVGLEAKIAKIEEEQAKAEKILSALHSVNLTHFIGEKLFNKVVQALDICIQEYSETKDKYYEKIKSQK